MNYLLNVVLSTILVSTANAKTTAQDFNNIGASSTLVLDNIPPPDFSPVKDAVSNIPRELSIEERIADKSLLKIASCESGLRQFNTDGTVLKSKYGTPDYGLFQINRLHFDEAKKLDMDIMTVDGNIAFAKYLYQREGAKPWYPSNNCHHLLG